MEENKDINQTQTTEESHVEQTSSSTPSPKKTFSTVILLKALSVILFFLIVAGGIRSSLRVFIEYNSYIINHTQTDLLIFILISLISFIFIPALALIYILKKGKNLFYLLGYFLLLVILFFSTNILIVALGLSMDHRIPKLKDIPITTPTPSATDSWKTFTNTRYGYSLKFPPNLYSAVMASSSYDAEKSDNVQLCPCPPGNVIYGPGAFNGPLVIYVKPNSENLTLTEYINKTRPSLIKQEAITLDNTPAIKGYTEVGGDVLIASESIYAIKNGYIYSITFLLSGTNDGDELKQFSEIVSTFKFIGDGSGESKCVVSGCSGQICGSEPIGSTCEYKEEYACYKSASCEKQADGKCGWTMDSNLTSCLNKHSSPTR